MIGQRGEVLASFSNYLSATVTGDRIYIMNRTCIVVTDVALTSNICMVM